MADKLIATASTFGNDRICAVVAALNARDALRQLRRALKSTRTVELRLDWLRDGTERHRFLAALNNLRPSATIIATCRHRDAGGRFDGPAATQLALLGSALRAGCRWCDLEVEALSRISGFALALHLRRGNWILSWHNFGRPQSEKSLRVRMSALESIRAKYGLAAIKIASQCESLSDALRVLRLARGARNVIAVPMGDAATPARILALREGSALAYAPVEAATAPGQLSLGEMKNLYRAARLGRHTRVYGVIGHPIAHSLSPHLHNAGFHARRVNAVYLPFDVEDLRDFLAALDPLGIRGFSITLPHKQAILRHLGGCDPLAAAIGAVNTVVVRDGGKLFGYNTDYVGVLRALERRIPLRGSRVLIFGAGGAARAVAFALQSAGASVAVCARRPARARKLARAVHGEFVPRSALRREFFDAIVNATPVGMSPREDASPLDARELNCRLVFDLIYRPRETKLLKLAARRGIERVSGLEMFLAQGIAQWEIWMGERAPEKPMRAAVIEALRREESAN
ncbi:MAG TPA: shikimate dehydrogenase [Candidatus Acidoferrales bacterium]|nr:shikimate dehydrogenase [Candidatus Acidoferrales bacterium]